MNHFKIALLCLFLISCAPKPQLAGEQEAVFVILPDNFIIDLASGSKVVLNPAVQTFVVFGSEDDARKKLVENTAKGLPGEWRIYELEGDFHSLATECGNEAYCLAQPARITTWLD